MIIQSANDACIVLAEALAGNEAEFGAKLTKRAREIGLTQSVFTNSNGLPDPDEKVTTRELGMLARHIILTYPDYYKIFGQTDFTWNKIKQPNRNPLLAMGIGADGLKTGFTKEAGYGLVGSAVQNGLRLIAVVAGLKNSAERASESRRLLEWGFKGFERRPLFADGQAIEEARVYGGAQWNVPLMAQGAVSLLLPRGSNDRIVARVVYVGPVRAPIAAGQPVGTLRVWRGDNVVLEVPLQASEAVARGGITRRALDAVAELVIGLFLSGTKRI
jgi:D-alanyl-D-alanine carboxypeptidase (penicillin-binding protein 5/6)